MQNPADHASKTSSPESSAGAAADAARGQPRRTLRLFDAASIIVGIIIGAGIYETTPAVAAHFGSLAGLLGVWLLGGLLAALGALCYCELACSYPEDGGDYVYLKRAFGLWMAFLFAWCEFWIVRPGAIGAMAFLFARYANQLWPLGVGPSAYGCYAGGAILLLSAVNMLGVDEGKWTQNVLTAAKVIGLAALFVVAFAGPAASAPALAPGPAPGESAAASAGGASMADYRIALILVLFTYGGWSEVAYVAAEVRDPDRNILAALFWGIGIVTGVYLLANLAFVHALGLDGLQSSHAAAADVLARRWGDAGSRAISLLVCLSTLGAINGQIFTGARIYYTLGADHPLLGRLGRWNSRVGAPIWSLAAQAFATLLPVLAIVVLQPRPKAAAPAEACRDAFERLVIFNTPVYWFFFLMVGVALFVLRSRDKSAPDHGTRRAAFRVPFYPWTPLVFCLLSGWMLWSGCAYSYEHRTVDGAWSVAILAIGVVASFWSTRAGRPSAAALPGAGG